MAARNGQRFCLYHPPSDPARGAVLYVHPWAEEMNKSRRMAALQSRALAKAGYAVLQIDLHGCGDSSGDFGDATWEGWLDDVTLGSEWLRERHRSPLSIWGLRAGCLLAAEAAQRIEDVDHLLFWQPVTAGRSMLQQFLRLKAVGDLDGAGAKATMETLRRQLASGNAVEIAGYALAPSLAAGLESSTLKTPPKVARLDWLEITTREDAGLLPISASLTEAWKSSGARVRTAVVAGPAFWQTTEIEEAPALIPATINAMQAAASG